MVAQVVYGELTDDHGANDALVRNATFSSLPDPAGAFSQAASRHALYLRYSRMPGGGAVARRHR